MRRTILMSVLVGAVVIGGVVAADRLVRPAILDATSHLPAALSIDPGALPGIVVSEPTVPAGMAIYANMTGIAALRASAVVPDVPPGVVEAVLTRFDDDEEHLGDHEGRYTTFAAAFLSEEHAASAFRIAVAHHASPQGWAMGQARGIPGAKKPPPALGDERALFTWGTDYGYPRLVVHLWRVDNVLLQAVDYHPYDQAPDFLDSVAAAMDARARP